MAEVINPPEPEEPKPAPPVPPAPPRPPPPPSNREEAIVAACPLCAAGDPPQWQQHSQEWVHRRSTRLVKGSMFAISLCGADHIRKQPP
jgi:hypothetical protein